MNTAVIPVTHKDLTYRALLDDEDFWLVLDRAYEERKRWRMAANGYVSLTVGGRHTLLLHRFLMNQEPGSGYFVDHINRDRLDNRRSNLRLLTPSQSTQNLGARCTSQTGYRGVMVLEGKRERRYQARVTVDGVRHYLGTFDTPEEAAEAAADGRGRLAPYSQEAWRVGA